MFIQGWPIVEFGDKNSRLLDRLMNGSELVQLYVPLPKQEN